MSFDTQDYMQPHQNPIADSDYDPNDGQQTPPPKSTKSKTRRPVASDEEGSGEDTRRDNKKSKHSARDKGDAKSKKKRRHDDDPDGSEDDPTPETKKTKEGGKKSDAPGGRTSPHDRKEGASGKPANSIAAAKSGGDVAKGSGEINKGSGETAKGSGGGAAKTGVDAAKSVGASGTNNASGTGNTSGSNNNSGSTDGTNKAGDAATPDKDSETKGTDADTKTSAPKGPYKVWDWLKDDAPPRKDAHGTVLINPNVWLHSSRYVHFYDLMRLPRSGWSIFPIQQNIGGKDNKTRLVLTLFHRDLVKAGLQKAGMTVYFQSPLAPMGNKCDMEPYGTYQSFSNEYLKARQEWEKKGGDSTSKAFFEHWAALDQPLFQNGAAHDPSPDGQVVDPMQNAKYQFSLGYDFQADRLMRTNDQGETIVVARLDADAMRKDAMGFKSLTIFLSNKVLRAACAWSILWNMFGSYVLNRLSKMAEGQRDKLIEQQGTDIVLPPHVYTLGLEGLDTPWFSDASADTKVDSKTSSSSSSKSAPGASGGPSTSSGSGDQGATGKQGSSDASGALPDATGKPPLGKSLADFSVSSETAMEEEAPLLQAFKIKGDDKNSSRNIRYQKKQEALGFTAGGGKKATQARTNTELPAPSQFLDGKAAKLIPEGCSLRAQAEYLKKPEHLKHYQDWHKDMLAYAAGKEKGMFNESPAAEVERETGEVTHGIRYSLKVFRNETKHGATRRPAEKEILENVDHMKWFKQGFRVRLPRVYPAMVKEGTITPYEWMKILFARGDTVGALAHFKTSVMTMPMGDFCRLIYEFDHTRLAIQSDPELRGMRTQNTGNISLAKKLYGDMMDDLMVDGTNLSVPCLMPPSSSEDGPPPLDDTKPETK